VTFLVDNQLPAALARFLSARGAQCQHVLDLGLAQAPDAEIGRYCEQYDMVLISKDEGFFQLAAEPGASIRLVWVRLGNCRNRELLSAMEIMWPRILACLDVGDRIVELR
jgi:predicted nuclease of predicted toxin-antitoxin system